MGITSYAIEVLQVSKLDNHIVFKLKGQIIAGVGEVNKKMLEKFGIKQPVFFAGFDWEVLSRLAADQTAVVKAISKFPAVQRDLALIVPKQLRYEEVEKTVQKIKPGTLQDIRLFDIFESEKLGTDKKSMAINFTFLDEEKTLTDKEIDGWMNKIMITLEKDLQAEIRK